MATADLIVLAPLYTRELVSTGQNPIQFSIFPSRLTPKVQHKRMTLPVRSAFHHQLSLRDGAVAAPEVHSTLLCIRTLVPGAQSR